MTAAGLRASLPPAAQIGPDDTQDFVLVRWAPGTDAAAAAHRLTAAVGHSGAYYTAGVVLPSAVADLGRMRELPLWLGVFFGLLACATVAHALVTTVRRRRFDLAVLRSFGFTRRQSRTAIAWQATLLAIVGLVVGVPLGVVTGRLIWRWLADNFPVVYVPPLALVAVLVVVPAALLIANALAAGPARAASRIHPAEVLRAE
jgi:predicted lysophospholipase L1 biosynthesis ABC-type transport system permease subunit